MLKTTTTPAYLTTQPVVAEFPAYRIVAADLTREFQYGEQFAVPYESGRYGTMYRMYTLGSVAGYAADYNEDPTAAVEQARARGEELYWANQNSTMLTAWDRPQETFPMVQYGDVIRFAGKQFFLDKANNNNIVLVELPAAS